LSADMPTLGEELRSRREARGLTLNDISEATRIGTRFLKAIETDNFSVVPGGIYLRAFIRSFAKEVGLDEDEAMALYQQQVAGTESYPKPEGERGARSSKETLSILAEEKTPRRAAPLTYTQPAERPNWSTIIITAGIMIFVAIIVIALVRELNKSSVESDAPPAASEPAAGEVAPAATETSQPAPQTPEAPPEPPASIPSSEPIKVQLAATTGDCWVRYQVDGGQPSQTILKTGQTIDVPPAQNEVKVSYGNRQTFGFKINGRDASLSPDAALFGGQVVITRDNLQTFLQ
ncbi:MAG TPA: RodZ domain-containing protein, partial [Blastocatellia bacterium]|nr:RodZ domain-containing protein [Blastocatellia bacterium]